MVLPMLRVTTNLLPKATGGTSSNHVFAQVAQTSPTLNLSSVQTIRSIEAAPRFPDQMKECQCYLSSTTKNIARFTIHPILSVIYIGQINLLNAQTQNSLRHVEVGIEIKCIAFLRIQNVL